MEFGRHLRTGIWGLAGKFLPVAYGLGYVLLVIRVLPERDFGNFVLLQEIFLILTGLATAIGLHPLLKFESEEAGAGKGVVGAAFIVHAAFLAATGLLLVVLREQVGAILRSTMLADLLPYLPAILAAATLRNFVLVMLQARFRLAAVFWVDAAHFLGAPVLIWVYSRLHLFDSALDLVMITIISLSASSVVGIIVVRRELPAMRFPSGAEVRKVLDYGTFALGGVVSYLFTTKADTLFLSAFAGPVAVAVYNAAKVFTRIFDMIPQVVQMFVLPGTSLLASRGEMGTLRVLVEKALLFTMLVMVPVMLVFLLAPGLLTGILYGGRYSEAVPVLRPFAVLGLTIPLMAVASNVLLGLGEVRATLRLAFELVLFSAVGYVTLIPLWGAPGAALAYVAATAIVAWRSVSVLRSHVPVHARDVLARVADVRGFLRTIGRLGRPPVGPPGS
jgi:O-antigen/teichoic acid export membrane protein